MQEELDLPETENEGDEGRHGRHVIGYPDLDDMQPIIFHQSGQLRAFAKSLKRAARARGFDLPHGTSLEATARIFGHADWGQLLRSAGDNKGDGIAEADKLEDAGVDACFLPRFTAVMMVSPDDALLLFQEVRLRLLQAIRSHLAEPDAMIALAKEKFGIAQVAAAASDSPKLTFDESYARSLVNKVPQREGPIVVIKKMRLLKHPPGKKVFNLG